MVFFLVECYIYEFCNEYLYCKKKSVCKLFGYLRFC